MDRLLQDLQALETAVAYRRPPARSAPPFSISEGERTVLISAPHGSAHTRNGKFKPEEEFTTAIARYLARETNSSAIFATHMNLSDPNWDIENHYKSALLDLKARRGISFVIDLHGMTNRHGFGIALGTINGRSCPDHENALVQTFLNDGFTQTAPPDQPSDLFGTNTPWPTFVLNHPRFTGGVKGHTITRFAVDSLKVPAVQIEMASKVRIVEREAHDKWPTYRGDPQGIYQTVSTLTTFIQSL